MRKRRSRSPARGAAPFRTGDLVEPYGLTGPKGAQLNGILGTVSGFQDDGRVVVSFPKPLGRIGLKPDRLRHGQGSLNDPEQRERVLRARLRMVQQDRPGREAPPPQQRKAKRDERGGAATAPAPASAPAATAAAAPTNDRAAQLSQFAKGQRVRTQGLRASDLNGLRGRVAAVNEQDGRVVVSFGRPHGKLGIRPINLVFLDGGRSASGRRRGSAEGAPRPKRRRRESPAAAPAASGQVAIRSSGPSTASSPSPAPARGASPATTEEELRQHSPAAVCEAVPPVSSAPEGYQCHQCGGTGHFAVHCPMRPQPQPAQPAPATADGAPRPPEGYECHKCGSSEHFAADCPQKAQEDEKLLAELRRQEEKERRRREKEERRRLKDEKREAKDRKATAQMLLQMGHDPAAVAEATGLAPPEPAAAAPAAAAAAAQAHRDALLAGLQLHSAYAPVGAPSASALEKPVVLRASLGHIQLDFPAEQGHCIFSREAHQELTSGRAPEWCNDDRCGHKEHHHTVATCGKVHVEKNHTRKYHALVAGMVQQLYPGELIPLRIPGHQPLQVPIGDIVLVPEIAALAGRSLGRSGFTVGWCDRDRQSQSCRRPDCHYAHIVPERAAHWVMAARQQGGQE